MPGQWRRWEDGHGRRAERWHGQRIRRRSVLSGRRERAENRHDQRALRFFAEGSWVWRRRRSWRGVGVRVGVVSSSVGLTCAFTTAVLRRRSGGSGVGRRVGI